MAKLTNPHCGAPSRWNTTDGPLAVGCVESSSIAHGMEAADAMLKAAQIQLLTANPICPGKYLTLVGGRVAEVTAAVAAGAQVAADTLVDETVIPNLHPQVLEALSATTFPEDIQAIGVIEAFSMAAIVVAGDEAVKAAAVTLLEIRLGRALGGKGTLVLTGEVSAVRAAVNAGMRAGQDQGLMLGSTVIPSPHPDLIESLL